MNFDDLKDVWQAAPAAHPPRAIDEALLHSVRQGSRKFDRAIFWRDVREVAASLVVALVFGHIAWSAQAEGSPAWPAWLATVLPLGVAAFFLVDRARSRRRHGPSGADVLTELDRAIAAVRHQITLLRNVLWWYLLPLGLSVVLLALQIVLYLPMNVPPEVALAVKIVVALVAIGPAFAFHWWVWKLNQKAVRDDLEPRLAELLERRREITGEA